MSSYVVQSHETRTWSFTGSPEAKCIVFVVAVWLLTIVPSFVFGVPSNRDLSNHFRFALPFYDAIAAGAGNATEARIKTFYYPHWVATSGTQVLPTRPDKDGALLVSLPADEVAVGLVFQEPRRSRLAAVASWAGFVFIGVLTLPLRLRRKQ